MAWLNNSELVQKFIGSLNSDRLSTKNQIILFTLIQDFLKNGFTLKETFSFCLMIHPDLKDAIIMIQHYLSKGHNFAGGIKSLVPFRTYCQIRIAEFHGNLIKTLGGISEFLKIKQRQKSKLISLMVYPIFLLILLIGIIITIHMLVTPQFQDLNANRQTHHYGLWILVSLIPLIAGAYGCWQYWREQSRVWQINFTLRLPLIGEVFRAYYAYYLSSNLALMMKCGMDLQQIITFMIRFRSNELILNLSQDVENLVNNGGSLINLRTKYHFLPKQMIRLIDNGDMTTVLAQKLDAYSKLEFKSMVKRSSRLISMLQPIMFLIIGLVIVGTYLSMLLPMYGSIKGVY